MAAITIGTTVLRTAAAAVVLAALSLHQALGQDGLPASADVQFTASIWADNWFALYVNGELVAEDSVPITTMRSFNSDIVTFRASYPLTIAVQTKDFIENDSGLEYIGSLFGLVPIGSWFTLTQQIGDGGFIAQIKETETDQLVAVTSLDWRGYVVHKAPLNPDCEKSRQPLVDCQSLIVEEPAGWYAAGFDDGAWVQATTYTKQEIGARFGYNDVDWDPSAHLIWTDDIDADNTILWRHQVGEPSATSPDTPSAAAHP
ncbi:MAG: PEBP family protein [Pseudomonadota bacterium]